jgi:peptide/nickel transport system permease protein
VSNFGPPIDVVEELAIAEGMSAPSQEMLGEMFDHVIAGRRRLGVLFWLSVGYVALNVLAVLFAPDFHLQKPDFPPFRDEWAAPSLAHWFGTDEQGRDIFARVVYGSRVSVILGFSAAGMGLVLGGFIGMLAGLVHGAVRNLIGLVMFVMLAIPGIISLIALTTFWLPTTVPKLILIIGVLATPLFYRVIFASTIATASREYVLIAKVQGASLVRVIFKEILPNILPTALSYFMIGIAGVVVIEGTLAFLGRSVAQPTPSWGNMINESLNQFPKSVYLALFPSLAICIFLVALNIIADRLQQYFSVSEVKL